MFTRIAMYVRTKPRTSALIMLAVIAGGALALWDAQHGGYWLFFVPLLACLGIHGLMHGGHSHGHGSQSGPPEGAAAAPHHDPRKDDAA
ncbi:MAG: DUF2933 domain-containing protein [Caenispirillum sp.]|nr:DUF2933 domain-containing protein [Caenispirillum sp.]